MDKRCKEWCFINHPENKLKWIWKVSMFRNVHHNFTRPCLKKMESGTWRCMNDFHRKLIVKGRQSHIDVKFPCLKFTMTPVLLLLSIVLLSLFWKKNEFKRITLIFKVTEDTISLLGRGNSTQIKTPRHWKKIIHPSLFCGLFFQITFFLIIGSLMNAC